MVRELQLALQAIHRRIGDTRAARLKANRKQQRRTVPIRFDIGDYVLVANVKSKITFAKLLCQWVGPFQVVGTHSPYVFRVKSLVDSSERDVHASRLQYYADSSLLVTRELKDHVSKQGLILNVEKFSDHRLLADGTYEILVHWKGFEDMEASWEPLTVIAADVPRLVDSYLSSLSTDTSASLRAALISSNSSSKEGSVDDSSS